MIVRHGVLWLLLFGLMLTLGITAFTVVVFVPKPPNDTIWAQEPESADLIVVLEGDIVIRLKAAFRLGDAGYAPIVYSPGLRYRQNFAFVAEQLKLEHNFRFVQESTSASSTIDEARRTRAFIPRLGRPVHTVILVTADYHSYRAWLTFVTLIPGVKVICVPARTATVDADGHVPEPFKGISASERRKTFYFVLLNWWRIPLRI